MPSINLIASRREEKRRLQQRTRRLAYAIASEVGVILLVASIMMVRIVGIRGHISDLDGQVSQLQPKVNQIQDLQDETARLKPKVATLNTARNTTLYWYTALQTVAASLPDQAWLTSLSAAGDPAPPKPAAANTQGGAAGASSAPMPTLTISGMAANSDQVGIAMMKMNQFANINSVTLNAVTQTQFQGRDAMNYSLLVTLKPNAASDITTPGFDVAAPPTMAAPAARLQPPVRQAAAPSALKGGVAHV